MKQLIVFACLLCVGIPVYAQTAGSDIRVNEVFYKVPLSKVLKTVQEEYQIKVAYDNNLVQNIIVALQLNDLSISESFERILEGTSLTFEKVGDNIVIFPRPPAPIPIPEKKDIRISGSVMDAETEESLPLATIRIPGTNISTTTNNDGYFSIFQIPNDTCTIVIRYLGYITQTIRVKDIDPSGQINIRLKNDTQILNTVVVLDEYNQAVHIEDQPGASVFNPKSLSTLPSLGEQDISRTLQLIPGITATDESSSGMVVRGSHPSYNLTLLDGMTIYQQDHFFGSFSIINADVIKDVRVHKGMFDARYGGRASGVVDITTKNGNAVKPSFNAKMNFINAKASAELPIGKKWSLFAGARRSLTDVVQSDLFNTLFGIAKTSNDQIEIFRFTESLGGRTGTPDFYFYDANTKLTFKPSTRDILSLSFYISRDKMNVRGNSVVDDGIDKFTIDSKEDTRWGNNGLSLRWGRQWNDRYYSNIRISDSKFFREYAYHQKVDMDTLQTDYVFGFENSIADLSYAVDNEWTLNDQVAINFGLQGSLQQTDIHMYDQYTFSEIPPGEFPGDTDITRDDFSWQHSLYGSVAFSPAPRLTVTPGARLVYYYNDYSAYDKLFFEPRLTANYKITEQLNLKTGYARSNQFISQLFYHSPTGSISGINENFWMLSRLGESRYPVISSDHVSAGATLKHKQLVYDGEVFYKTSRGVIMDEDLNSASTRAYGLDLMIQKTSGINRGWIAYSLAFATQEHPSINNGDPAPTWQDQRHELKVVDMLMLGKWNLSSTLILGSGKPYPKYRVQYSYNDTGAIDDYSLRLDYSNESRLPAYFRIDLAASYGIRFKKSGEVLIGLSIHNITNHKNIKTRKINTTALDEAILTNTEVPATYNDIVLLGFTPTLSVSVSF